MNAMIRTGARVLSAMPPEVAARAALALFLHVGPRMALAEADEPMMLQARRWEAEIPGIRGRGARALVHEWGTGADVVLLVHGWQGRASQFAPLARELVGEGFRVVAVDMPAHGDAPGRSTYIVDWVDTIRAVQARHGALHGIVGHSLGGLATLVAVAEGVQARRVVTASAPASARAVFDVFAARLGLDRRADAAMRDLFARRHFDGGDPLGRFSVPGSAFPSSLRTLVAHDVRDRVIAHREAQLLRESMPQATSLDTDRAWHARLVRADAFLDAAVGHLAAADLRVPQPAGSALARRL